jgi:acetylornithine/succinyldiaminopimelate/putrescine aminotransferase
MQAKHRKGFEPLMPGFKEAVFNDFESFLSVVDKHTAAVILEPLQGEGGINSAEKFFMSSLAKYCREHDVLLIVDEVQCGMGRTGKLFAHQHYGVEPDIMTLAKPLAGGLPIGATIVGPRVWPHIKPGEHASTFGGNHFVMGVANGVFDIISSKAFIDDVASKGSYFAEKLGDIMGNYPSVKAVKGTGLLLGVEVDFSAADAVEYFQNEHLLICVAGPSVIRFIPPLIITRNEIDRAVQTLDTFLSRRTAC